MDRRHSLWPALLIAAVPLLLLARGGAAEERIAARIGEAPPKHPIVPALKLANECLEALEDVTDYEAVFVKKETVDGQVVTQKMRIRFREQPMSVYLKYIQPNPGREVLYVDGRYDNQLQVRETGIASLVGTISLDPNGSLAMGESKYAITMIGMKNMVVRLMESWLDDTAHENVVVKFYPEAKMGDLACEVIEVTHPKPGAGITYHKTRLYRDKQSKLPIRIQEFEFPSKSGGKATLRADYAYLDLKPNAGLKDIDFDTANPQYGF